MHDVIVVGARVAGAATARLLALQGLKVLCLDRATFPAETVSSHQVQLPGGAQLLRWGLLEKVAAATPATRSVRFDPGPAVLQGRFPTYLGVDALYSPKRTILDPILVEAARQAGATVREGCTVEKVLFDQGRARGIRLRTPNGASFSEEARFVVGADGKHSVVAACVGAPRYREQPSRTFAYYAYWDGVKQDGAEVYERPTRSVGVWPTSDGQVVTFLAAPAAEFAAFRTDIEGNFFRTFDTMGDLGERIRSATRVGRFMGSADLPNFFRKPWGAGWALVGDAGLTMDPITGQGISQALQDAELVSRAIGQGFGGTSSFDAALAAYEQARNRRALPIYELTQNLARFASRPYEEDVFYRAMVHHPAEVGRLLGVLAGALTLREFSSPARMLRVIGLRGIVSIVADKLHIKKGRR